MSGGLKQIGLCPVFYLIALVIIVSCSGGSGDDGQFQPAGLAADLDGEWVSECRQYQNPGDYAWEKIVFNRQSGEVADILELFKTSDCSDSGVVQSSMEGDYDTGKEINCPSGYNGKCTELDIFWDNGTNHYGIYSVYANNDPDTVCLSTFERDPSNRNDDVNPQHPFSNIPFPGNDGTAIIRLTVMDSGFSSTPPTPPAGYTLLPIDLNEGTLGTYVWLYYKMGRADGLDGTPIGDIYTVHESDGETPISADDIKIPVNLNGTTAASNFLWLYYSISTGNVVRGVVVANETDNDTVYGPPGVETQPYTEVWVEELLPGTSKTPSGYPQPPDAQDLNEGFSLISYIYLGYYID